MQPLANNSPKSILRTLRMKSILQNIFQNLASRGDTHICLKKREYLQSIKSLKARIVVAVLYPGGMPREKLPCRRLEDNTPKETLQHRNNNNNPDVFWFYWGKVHYLACSQNSKIRFFFWALVAIFREGIERDKREYGGGALHKSQALGIIAFHKNPFNTSMLKTFCSMDSMDGQLETKLDWSTHSLESSDDI